MNSTELLEIVYADALKHNIKTSFLVQKDVFTMGVACSGFFDDVKMEIAVAMDKPEADWFPVLIHEYMHMKQWSEKSDLWVNMEGADQKMDEWFAGREFTTEEVTRFINDLQAVEADCERRSVAFIKEHNISQIDPVEYAKKANSYIYFYCMIAERRKFYDPEKRPYNVEAVWSQMPEHFNNDYTILPEQFRELYEEYC